MLFFLDTVYRQRSGSYGFSGISTSPPCVTCAERKRRMQCARALRRLASSGTHASHAHRCLVLFQPLTRAVTVAHEQLDFFRIVLDWQPHECVLLGRRTQEPPAEYSALLGKEAMRDFGTFFTCFRRSQCSQLLTMYSRSRCHSEIARVQATRCERPREGPCMG